MKTISKEQVAAQQAVERIIDSGDINAIEKGFFEFGDALVNIAREHTGQKIESDFVNTPLMGWYTIEYMARLTGRSFSKRILRRVSWANDVVVKHDYFGKEAYSIKAWLSAYGDIIGGFVGRM